MNGGYLGAARYVHDAVVSDVPSTYSQPVAEEFATARADLFRTVIREAPMTW